MKANRGNRALQRWAGGWVVCECWGGVGGGWAYCRLSQGAGTDREAGQGGVHDIADFDWSVMRLLGKLGVPFRRQAGPGACCGQL